jgi:hypothetical protein
MRALWIVITLLILVVGISVAVWLTLPPTDGEQGDMDSLKVSSN